MKALGNILGVTLADPSNEPNNKHFEVVAASMRYASGDRLPQTFVYVDKCSVNRVHNPALYTVSTEPAVISVDQASWDSYFGDEVTTPTAEELAALSKDYEAHAEERLKERVQKVIDWSNGIDNKVNILRSSMIERQDILRKDIHRSRLDSLIGFRLAPAHKHERRNVKRL